MSKFNHIGKGSYTPREIAHTLTGMAFDTSSNKINSANDYLLRNSNSTKEEMDDHYRHVVSGISYIKLLQVICSMLYYRFYYANRDLYRVVRKYNFIRILINKIKYNIKAKKYKKRLSQTEIKNLTETQIFTIKQQYKNELFFGKKELPYIIHDRKRYDLLDSERNPINDELYRVLFSDMLCYKFDSCGKNIENMFERPPISADNVDDYEDGYTPPDKSNFA